MRVSPVKMGWILVMFDLPVMTHEERRTASKFRNDLRDNGYMMIQYSVYTKPCVTPDQLEKHTHRLVPFIPAGGNVRVLFLTDTQWKKAVTKIGNDKKRGELAADPQMPTQMVFWE